MMKWFEPGQLSLANACYSAISSRRSIKTRSDRCSVRVDTVHFSPSVATLGRQTP